MNYIVRITESGPLSFRAGRETTSAETLSYVPGSTLLGGLAAAHRLLRRGDTEQFDAFFFSDESRFGNLYPAVFTKEDLTRATDPVHPIPTTAVSCKRFGGFVFDEEDADRQPHHGVHDSLIHQALFALSGESNSSVLAPLKHCPRCNDQTPLDQFSGFYRRGTLDPEAIGTTEATVGIRTRTGINRATGTVQRGILYSREVLRSGTRFWGTVTVPDAEESNFYEFIEEASNSGLLRLGNNRTRGFGRVTLYLNEKDDNETGATLRSRIEQFNDTLRQRAKEAGIDTPHALYVPLTLTSNTILLDRLLRYRTTIEPDYLADEWGIEGAELIYQHSGTRRVMGWNVLWRVPKPDEIAITMGSVFLFGLSTELDEDLLQALLRMQRKGIGHRRREGFGQVMVANPFHWEVEGR